MTGAARGLRATALALVLAVPLLAGCDAAQQAQQGVDKAADCAGLQRVRVPHPGGGVYHARPPSASRSANIPPPCFGSASVLLL